MNRLILTLLLLFITHVCNCLLPILKECRYQSDEDHITLYSNIWTIPARGKSVLFSTCGQKVGLCNPASVVCLSEKNTLKSLATGFEVKKTEDELFLQSFGGDRCLEDPKKNYSVNVEFECKKATKITPKLVQDQDDPCRYKITMLNAECKLPCSVNIHGNIIDLRALKKLGDITVPSENGNFYLRFCAAAEKCGDNNLAACYKHANGSLTGIADVSPLNLKYTQKNGLVLAGKHTYGKLHGEYNTLEVMLRCNWTTELSNARYVRPVKQGRNYKFLIDSSKACIKLPMPCKTVDEAQAYYDISGLHNKRNFWVAHNYTNGSLMLNVCGQINKTYFGGSNDCSMTDAQICHTDDGIYKSKGSLYSDLVVKDDILHITFTDGSLCTFDSKTVSSQTEMQFKCAPEEKGPVYKGEVNCVGHVLWETPHACPYHEYTGSQCYIVDVLGKRNLSGIHLTTDRTTFLQDSSVLRYNLCGPLSTTCAGFKNVSVCLIKNTREYIIGWENTLLRSKNGILSLDLTGENCENGLKSRVAVKFICDYFAENASYVVGVVRESCMYNITVRTKFACLSQDTAQCTVSNGSKIYDLTPLSQHNTNYMIDGGNDQFEYIINVCRPIVVNDRALCRTGTTICQRNLTDFNVKRTFKTLATLHPLVVDGDRLKFESVSEYCSKGKNYKTIIYFECSQYEEGVQLVQQSECYYEFLWRTAHACDKKLLRKKRCILNYNETNLDLSDIKQKSVLVKDYNSTAKLTFNICDNNYKKCNDDNNQCETVNVTKTLVYKSDARYIDIETGEGCLIRVNLECGENDGFFQKYSRVTSSSKCKIYLQLRSKSVCDKEGKLSYKTVTQPQNKRILNQHFITYPIECSLINNFNMTKIDPIELYSKSGTSYSLNFSNIFTANSTNKNCPKTEFNNKNYTIYVIFKTLQQCNESGFSWYINFNCHEDFSYVQLKAEDTCSMSADYYTREACHIFISSHSTTTTLIVVCVIVLLVTVLISVYCYIRHVRRKYRLISEKRNVPVYLKDCID